MGETLDLLFSLHDQATRKNHLAQLRRHLSSPPSLQEYLSSFSGKDEYGRLHDFAKYAQEEPFAARAVSVLGDLNHGHLSRNFFDEASIVLGFVARNGGQDYARNWYSPYHMRLLLDSHPKRDEIDLRWQTFLQAESIRTMLEERGIFNPGKDRFSWAATAAFSVLQAGDPFLPPEQILQNIPPELRRPYFRNAERLADITSSITRMRDIGLLPYQSIQEPTAIIRTTRRTQPQVPKRIAIAS